MQTAVALRRVRIRISGAVQGVGFRPFVHRLAHGLGVTGWIINDPSGVVIEAEADDEIVAAFLEQLSAAAPPRAVIHDMDVLSIETQHSSAFRIMESESGGAKQAVVLPDIATCDDCRAELLDPADRRAGYAFTNCTNCGPRFSIIRALPYDRANTTMVGFAMCDRCRGEYRYTLDRRFHAQPNACPVCGPQLELLDATGRRSACRDPIAATADALRRGQTVAVKGIGGFHLMVDACNGPAVARLRERKHRPTKPLAVMVASVDAARRVVDIDPVAARLLTSAEAPIVLLPRRTERGRTNQHGVRLAAGVAPHNPFIGVMLPATPLHHLLMRAFGGPLVATSGNRSDEPICTDEQEAITRLAGIADMFLVHDRPIERHVDDSVAMVLDGAPALLRRARGYAPLPVLVDGPLPELIAVGPHLKNTIALSKGRQVFISQHIGDLETVEAQHAFARAATDLMRLYDIQPTAIAHDLHPDYESTRFAEQLAERFVVPRVPVQHHHAHMVSCMAENRVSATTLGVVWDGTGLGTDQTIWGGEFLLGDAARFTRVAHLWPFRLAGGEAAVREPRRVAVALVDAAAGRDAVLADGVVRDMIHPAQLNVLLHMMDSGLNAPVTTSAGRLFDGIAALLGICAVSTYEGEAAIRLEHAADAGEHGAYEVALVHGPDAAAALDWRPLIGALLEDRRRGVAVELIAARVHNALAAAIALTAEITGCERVALSGGCFQNRLLLERAARALRHRGFHVLQHHQVPANDGGVSLGQILIAAARPRDN
jgi:hydrogenase maturation protein HypF